MRDNPLDSDVGPCFEGLDQFFGQGGGNVGKDIVHGEAQDRPFHSIFA